MTKIQLIKHNQILWQMLNRANQYLGKAVADNELQGCAVSVENTFHCISDVLKDTKSLNNQSGFSTISYLLLACIPASLVFFGLLPFLSLIKPI